MSVVRTAKAMGIDVLPPQQVCQILSAVTMRPLPVPSVSAWLQQLGLLKRNRAGEWTGTLLEVQDPDFESGVDKLIEHLQLPGVQTIDTTRPEFALLAAGLVQTAVALELVSPQQVAELYAFGDGVRFPGGVSLQAWEAAVAASALDEALEEIRELYTAAIEAAAEAKRSAGATPEGMREAARAVVLGGE